MTVRLNPPLHPHSCYYTDNSLVLQFILSEMMAAFPFLEEVKKHSSGKPTHEQALNKALGHLAGAREDYHKICCWNRNDGCLGKLKSYGTFFVANELSVTPEAKDLQRHAEHAWAHSIDALYYLDIKAPTPYGQNRDIQKLQSALRKMRHRFRSFIKSAEELCLQCGDDENVLNFLLTHQEALDKLYKTHFVYSTFCHLFPKGLDQAKKFLLQRFEARGFAQILPKISEKIETLETEIALV